jgi:hypothetical protein
MHVMQPIPQQHPHATPSLCAVAAMRIQITDGRGSGPAEGVLSWLLLACMSTWHPASRPSATNTRTTPDTTMPPCKHPAPPSSRSLREARGRIGPQRGGECPISPLA